MKSKASFGSTQITAITGGRTHTLEDNKRALCSFKIKTFPAKTLQGYIDSSLRKFSKSIGDEEKYHEEL